MIGVNMNIDDLLQMAYDNALPDEATSEEREAMEQQKQERLRELKQWDEFDEDSEFWP